MRWWPRCVTLRNLHSLGRELRDVGLFPKKPIAFRFRDYDVTKSWKPFNQPALNESSDGKRRKTSKVFASFFELKRASVVKRNCLILNGCHAQPLAPTSSKANAENVYSSGASVHVFSREIARLVYMEFPARGETFGSSDQYLDNRARLGRAALATTISAVSSL
jgi:hypothetical protein